jgi:ligand-binding SRPBCC domain-containing protein
MEHVLKRELLVGRPRNEVFAFFADAHNLEELTPPFLNFRIESMDTPQIERGTHIVYSLRLHGIRIGWTTVIEVWEPPVRFVDLQLKGPYKLWRHEHTFKEVAGGTIVGDEVRYRLPFGFAGDLAHWWVRRDVEGIFDYRTAKVRELFGVRRSG